MVDAAKAPKVIKPDVCSMIGKTIVDPSSGIGAVVPDEGTTVTVNVLLGPAPDGSGGGSDHLVVATQDDGTVVVSAQGPDSNALLGGGVTNEQDPETNAPISLAPSACDDDDWGDLGFQENDQFQWWYNESSAPNTPMFTSRSEIDDLRAGVSNMTHADSNCSNVSDTVSATASWQGESSFGPNIALTTCNAEDSYNVVGWGNLGYSPSGSQFVALNCWWAGPFDLHHSDIKLSKGDGSGNNILWTFTPNTNCPGGNRYDVESVMTHEFGHALGLDDLYGDDNNLTMYGSSFYCKSSARTIGYGDWKGLDQKY